LCWTQFPYSIICFTFSLSQDVSMFFELEAEDLEDWNDDEDQDIMNMVESDI